MANPENRSASSRCRRWGSGYQMARNMLEQTRSQKELLEARALEAQTLELRASAFQTPLSEARAWEARALPQQTLEQQRRIFEICQERLDDAEGCLEARPRRSFAFWEAIHEADELLLNVTPSDMLLPRAIEIRELFRQKFKSDPALCSAWLESERGATPLTDLIRRLEGYARGEHRQPEDELEADRDTLRTALHTVNRKTDNGFWQLNMNVLIQNFSALLLAVIAGVAVVVVSWVGLPLASSTEPPELLLAVISPLAGAAGAIFSNMVSRRVSITTIGATGRHIVYFLFAKPIVGAFAGLFFYALARSQLLFNIAAEPAGKKAAPIQITVGTNDALLFAFAAIAVAFGYFGERLLSSLFEDLIGKMYQKSEKVLRTPVHMEEKEASA